MRKRPAWRHRDTANAPGQCCREWCSYHFGLFRINARM